MYGMQDHSSPVPLDFRDILAILRIRKLTILAITLFFVVAAVLYSRSQPKVYESRAEVLVRPITFAAGRFTDTGPSLLDMETEAKVATSRGVATLAAKTLRVTTTPDALLSSLSVSEERTSAVLDFTYASHTRSGAQKVAQAFADAYLDYRRQQALDDILASSRAMQEQLTLLENRLDAINTQIATTTDASQRQLLLAQTNLLSGQIALLEQNLVQLTPPDTLPVGDILQPADLPSSASSPKTVRNVGLALMMGLGLAIAWAIFKERLDDRLRGPDDVGAFGEIPVLASIPTPKRRRRSAFVLAVQQTPNSPESVAYHKLRTTILAEMNGNPMTLMVASSEEDETRPAAAANLAAALALAGKRVTLVSADLRKPQVHRYFRETYADSWAGTSRRAMLSGRGPAHLVNHVGLSDVLAKGVTVGEAVTPTEIKNLSLLTAGSLVANPTELLGSPAMAQVLRNLERESDVVVIDAAPVLSVADTLALAPNVDGVLLIVKSGSTRRQTLERAWQQLQQVKSKVMGTVFTNFDDN